MYCIVESNKVVIVAKQFLYRLGIQTAISLIDFKPDIVEISEFNDLDDELTYNKGIRYVIIGEEMLPDTAVFKDLLEKHTEISFLIIGKTPFDVLPENLSQVAEQSRKRDMMDILHTFFQDSTGESPTDEGPEQQQLSEREIEVLKLVAIGYANKEIADQLFISINTVITHRKKITEKLGIKSIAGLTVYALMNNYISSTDVKI